MKKETLKNLSDTTAMQLGVEAPMIHDQIRPPQVEVAVKAFEEVVKDPQKTDVLQQILDGVVKEEIANIHIFRMESGEAALPYAHIDATAFATKLYKEYKGTPLGEGVAVSASKDVDPKRKIFLTFGSFVNRDGGHPFNYVEIAMQKTIRSIRNVIADLEAGKIPDQIDVYTLGSPTNNRWGTITPEFVNKCKEDTFKTLGNTYAELVKKILPTDDSAKEKTAVVFEGISMGGSFAVKTAERLLQDGVVTQSSSQRSEEKLPFVQVIMDSPSGLNTSKLRAAQVKYGFIADAAYTLITDAGVRKIISQEGKFLAELEKQLQERGISPVVDKEQDKLKSQALKSLIAQLRHGISLPPDGRVKVNIRRGTNDATLYSRNWKKQAMQKRESYEEGKVPLGQTITSDSTNTARTFSVRAGHVFPFFTANEMGKWDKSVDSLLHLRQTN